MAKLAYDGLRMKGFLGFLVGTHSADGEEYREAVLDSDILVADEEAFPLAWPDLKASPRRTFGLEDCRRARHRLSIVIMVLMSKRTQEEQS